MNINLNTSSLSVPRLPTIKTVENCMKLCSLIVQGFWEFKNPLLQLPHITEDNLKCFLPKKVHSSYNVLYNKLSLYSQLDEFPFT